MTTRRKPSSNNPLDLEAFQCSAELQDRASKWDGSLSPEKRPIIRLQTAGSKHTQQLPNAAVGLSDARMCLMEPRSQHMSHGP